VRVTNEGNVVPWILASQAVIHNGCTTGVEAYVLGVAAVSYRPTVNDYYDLGFYRLPNLLSYQCFDFHELRGTLEDILAGKLGPPDGDERGTLLNQYLVALDGPFACERMVDVLEKIVQSGWELPRPPVHDRLAGRSLSAIRTLIKRCKELIPGSHNRPEFQRHRYPEVSLKEIRMRLARFQQVLGDDRELKVEQKLQHFFLVSE
jgi:hypothetical protein